jgi:hypothetical protein
MHLLLQNMIDYHNVLVVKLWEQMNNTTFSVELNKTTFSTYVHFIIVWRYLETWFLAKLDEKHNQGVRFFR